jgi:putative N6-adenine-specific DNA methylase
VGVKEHVRFFATAAKGTEPALRDELRENRFPHVRADRGGVHFEGPLEEGFRACLVLRCAGRVLHEVGRFEAKTADALYDGVRTIDWCEHLNAQKTLAVRATCRSSALTHTQFVAQRTKDAIVDQIREREGGRPSVDREDPDVTVFVHLAKDEATIYLDLSGESLHRRGYREVPTEAPLKEHLAAAILRIAGWDRRSALVDPMCGSGTLAIEAWLWSRNFAPGLARAQFGFERWTSHDETKRRTMVELREEARQKMLSEGPAIFASDVDASALKAATDAARIAGASIEMRRADVADLEPLRLPAHVVTNPPYGERLSGDDVLYRRMATALHRLRGHHVSILAGTPAIPRAIPIRPVRSHALWNGDLECRLLTYEVR